MTVNPRTLSDGERVDWLRLARTPSVGPVTFHGLIKRYGTAGKALDALPDLTRKAGGKRRAIPPPRSRIKNEIAATERHGAHIVASCEPGFPSGLRHLDPPPPVLTILGDAKLAQRSCIAIVGARNASAAGVKLARDFASAFGAASHVVTSGLARGIDGAAHTASLDSGTIAVLGGGIDQVYPSEHDQLYAAIAEAGLIVTESPFGHVAQAKDFPRRNRLIAGISRALVVVEAAERSGSLISARMAAEQGRDVFAVPGSPLDPRAAGTNRLIREGAALASDPSHVLEALSPLAVREVSMPGGDAFEPDPDDPPEPGQVEAVLQALSPTPMPIDEIARAAGIGPARCVAILIELELAGLAITLPGGLAGLDVS